MNYYMFDTLTLKALLKSNTELVKASRINNRYFVTKVQQEEISDLYNDLTELFIPAPDSQEGSHIPVLSILDRAEKKSENIDNAAVVSLCLANKYTLVTDIVILAETAWKYGVKVNNSYEFVKSMRGTLGE